MHVCACVFVLVHVCVVIVSLYKHTHAGMSASHVCAATHAHVCLSVWVHMYVDVVVDIQ